VIYKIKLTIMKEIKNEKHNLSKKMRQIIANQIIINNLENTVENRNMIYNVITEILNERLTIMSN